MLCVDHDDDDDDEDDEDDDDDDDDVGRIGHQQQALRQLFLGILQRIVLPVFSHEI